MEEFSNTKTIDRQRKKAFYNAIRNQIEFYLGDVNLSKDRFFFKLLQQSPYIDIDTLLKCNKIKKLTTEAKHIIRALKKSDIISVTDDGTKVYRTAPVKKIENTDDCTIYVEDLPLEADHDWIKSIFEAFGEVVYVSVPHYKLSKKIKGFAFVQFGSPESVEKTLKAFRAVNSCLSSNMAPSTLRSVQTFEGQKDIVTLEHKDQNLEEIKCIQSELEFSLDETENEPRKKKRKNEVKEINIDNQSNVEDTDVQLNLLTDEAIDEQNLQSAITNSTYATDKHSRKRKRKKHKKAEKVETHGMQILSKQDWKKLRNKYLEEQRKRMHELKQQLKKTSWSQIEKYKQLEKMIIDEKPVPVSSTTECRVKFVPGVIIKIHLDQPIKDAKNFKSEVKRYANVEYIDVQDNDIEAYLRCSSNEVANQVIALNKWPNMTILYGEEELAYWAKIKQDRKEKFDNKIRCKSRGKNKLIKKVETAMASHIKFSD